jgi:hypothetical protein
MTDITNSKDEDWEDDDEIVEELDGAVASNVMQFSDYVEPDEKHLQKHRITELRRRAEERQDWKRISHEYDWDFDEDDVLEEA